MVSSSFYFRLIDSRPSSRRFHGTTHVNTYVSQHDAYDHSTTTRRRNGNPQFFVGMK